MYLRPLRRPFILVDIRKINQYPMNRRKAETLKSSNLLFQKTRNFESCRTFFRFETRSSQHNRCCLNQNPSHEVEHLQGRHRVIRLSSSNRRISSGKFLAELGTELQSRIRLFSVPEMGSGGERWKKKDWRKDVLGRWALN